MWLRWLATLGYLKNRLEKDSRQTAQSDANRKPLEYRFRISGNPVLALANPRNFSVLARESAFLYQHFRRVATAQETGTAKALQHQR